MSGAQSMDRDRGFATLRRFARRRPPTEMCDLCGIELAAGHQHLVEPATRRLVCACDACAILFSYQGDAKFRRVPRRVAALDDFQLGDAQWEALSIPIGLAFFFENSSQGRTVAFYPSPAGATESLLPLGPWQDIVAANPALRDMEADVEALLVNRIQRPVPNGVARAYIVPIDVCYQLVGIIRSLWRGFAGGNEVWVEVDRFFEELAVRTGALARGAR